MAESNKLDEPLSETEYDALEAFFGSNAVPQDCMDLEMLDGFLTAIVSGPELIQPSEWLPVVWSDSQRSASPVFADNEQAERILSLILRLQSGIVRTLTDSPPASSRYSIVPRKASRADPAGSPKATARRKRRPLRRAPGARAT